jgi:MFS family permease
VLPPLLENIASDLNTSFSTIGFIATVTFLIFGTGALVGGPLSDRLGSLTVAKISIGLGGVMTLLFMIAYNVYVFSAAMFLMALWASFYHPTANGLIAKAFTENTGNAMGVHNAAGNLGQVLTPTVAFFLGVTFNWRISFVFFGALSVITAYLLNRIQVDEGRIDFVKASYFDFFRLPGFWMIVVYNVLAGFLFRSVDLFFPSLLSMERDYSGGIAALANSLIILFGTIGQIIGGRGSDKYGASRLLIGSSSGMILGLLVLLLFPGSVYGVILFAVLYGIGIYSHQPAVTNLVSKVSPRNLMGLAYGIMFFSAFGVGSFSTTISGYLADSYSLTMAFWVNALIAGVSLLIAFLMQLKFSDVR